MFIWDQIYNEAWLLKAMLKLHTKALFNRQKAFTTSHDGRTFFDFTQHSTRHLKKIHDKLKAGRFEFRPAQARHHIFNGKSRTLYLLPWEERIVDTLLYLLLNEVLGNQMSKNSYAYRTNGLTLELCQKRIAKLTSNTMGLYIIKRDISNYFASVKHAPLIKDLRSRFDDKFWNLILSRIHFSFIDDGQVKLADQGLPFGCASACFFSNWNLDILDKRLEKISSLSYFRYSDDCLVLTKNKNVAEIATNIMEQTVDELGLQFKAKQYHDWFFCHEYQNPEDELFKNVDRFKHLGLEFRAKGPHGLSKDKLRKIRNLFLSSFKRHQRQWAAMSDEKRRIQQLIKLSIKNMEEGIRSVALLDYYLDHTSDEAQLKDLDRWLALEILSQALDKGHNKGLFKRYSFQQLRQWGLPSLLHRSKKLRHGQLTKSFLFWKKPVGCPTYPDSMDASPPL